MQGTFLIRLEEIESNYVDRLAELETRVSEFVVRTGVCLLQCEYVWHGVLQCVAVCCSGVLRCVAVYCSGMLQCVVVRCSANSHSARTAELECCSALQYVAVRCSARTHM